MPREISQDVSYFQPLAKEDCLSTTAVPNILLKKSPRFIAAPTFETLLKRSCTKLYRLLDASLEERSFVFYNRKEKALEPFSGIIRFLREKGIINKVWSLEQRYNDAPSFVRFGIETNYGEWVTDGKKRLDPFGHGFGRDVETAFSKAIGEFLERYFLTLYYRKNLISGSYRALRSKQRGLVNLNDIAEFSSEQKDHNHRFQWDENSVFFWERAKRALKKAEVLVPAQFIYWNYIPDSKEPLLIDQTTSGCGGYFTKEGATLSGLYELIHRDAFLIFWLNFIAPPQISPETVPDKIFQELYQESRRYRFQIYCLNTTADTGVPSFIVVIGDESGAGPRFTLGGGCQADPAQALRRALEEAWSVYHWMRNQPEYSLPEQYQPFRDRSVGQNERLRLWCNPKSEEKFAFLLAGKHYDFLDFHFSYPSNFPSQTAELDYLVKQVENLGSGYEVYYFMARHPILDQIGYYSVKVVVPQFIPLYLQETMIPLASTRLKDVPAKLGYTPAETLNPYPHPFP